MKRFIYEIAGFIPPKEHSFSGNDFSIDLSADFARTCLKSKIDEKTREYFMTMAAGMARITQVANPLAIRCETFEETLLLKTINLGTNCTCLGINHSSVKRLEGINCDSIEYSPHNIDTIGQAHAMLSIFLQWVAAAKAITNYDSFH